LVPVPMAREFVARLREASRQPVVYVELPGTQHAFDVFLSIRSAAVVRAVERFADLTHARWRREREPNPAAVRPEDEQVSAAPPAQRVLLPVDEVQIPAGIEPPVVAGVVPEPRPRLEGRLGPAPVALEHRVRDAGPNDDLAHLPRGDLAVAVVEHPNVEVRRG